MNNTFGESFSISTFGESHGGAVGVIVDGCPANIELTAADIQTQLTRRRPGQSDLTTPRDESDSIEILSGIEHGKTLGTPIAMMVRNKTQRPGDYTEMAKTPRPSHADFTYQMKYGNRAESGGGRASARETIARVAGGALAEKILAEKYGVEIVALVSQIGSTVFTEIDQSVTRAQIDANDVRCPNEPIAEAMREEILDALADHDSIGGVITCICRNVPVGLGEPAFDKIEALLAQAMLSIPAAKGFEIGSGFAGAAMRGSEHNDPFVQKGDRLGTVTNHSGGVQGGISNGENIVFRVAFKPTATIGMEQQTATFDGQEITLAAKGRHDPCVLPRAVPIVEAMAALVLCDLDQRQGFRR